MSRVTSDRLKYFFKSMRVANMNCIRVWGGGVYESNEFYDMADHNGILIWHDMMFAVALYPTNHQFLKTVSTEITQQISAQFT
jgi:beta-mannosidase